MKLDSKKFIAYFDQGWLKFGFIPPKTQGTADSWEAFYVCIANFLGS